MLKIVRSIKELDFRNMAEVYAQSCHERGACNYPDYPITQQILLAEQEMYGDVKCFLRDKNAFYALWEADGRYVSVLRMEPYKDGLLLEGLETLPQEQKKGYATKLMLAVIAHLSGTETTIIYSHIDKKNMASIRAHLACGFEKIQDYAVYADGSISHRAYTMQKKV